MQIQLKYWASSFALGEGREDIRIILGDHRNDGRTAEAYRLILPRRAKDRKYTTDFN